MLAPNSVFFCESIKKASPKASWVDRDLLESPLAFKVDCVDYNSTEATERLRSGQSHDLTDTSKNKVHDLGTCLLSTNGSEPLPVVGSHIQALC